MKKTVIAALAVFGTLTLSAAPQVRWLATEHNYGAFDEDEGNVTCTFTYINDGDEPLTVTAARATCGCTTPEFTRHPVEPGDSGTVSVTYNPTGRPGRFDKKVYVDFNTTPERSTLRIKGVVIGSANTLRSRFPLDAAPLRLKGDHVVFGTVKTARAKTQFVDIYNASGDTVTPVWHNLPPYLSVTPSSPVIAPGEQETYTLYLVSDRAKTVGTLTDSIGLGVAGDPAGKITPITFTAVIEEDFSYLTPSMRRNAPVAQFDTDRIDFDRYTPDTPLTGSLRVTNKGKSPLMIRRAYSLDPGITVTVDNDKIKKGKTGVIRVTVGDDALRNDGIINARVQVITNDPEHPVTNIRITGIPAK